MGNCVIISVIIKVCFFMKSMRSFIKILNDIGPRIDPFGTPNNISQTCQVQRFWNKSHGLTVRFKNPTVNSKREKNYFPHRHLAFVEKRSVCFPSWETAVFSTLFHTEYGSIIKEGIEICSDHLGFFHLHDISVRVTVLCAFPLQIKKI